MHTHLHFRKFNFYTWMDRIRLGGVRIFCKMHAEICSYKIDFQNRENWDMNRVNSNHIVIKPSTGPGAWIPPFPSYVTQTSCSTSLRPPFAYLWNGDDSSGVTVQNVAVRIKCRSPMVLLAQCLGIASLQILSCWHLCCI